MLKDPAKVFAQAEATAAAYHARMQAERAAREQSAREIVMGLGDSLGDDDDDTTNDPLQDVSDSLDSLLS
jgi:hypothetical protein